MILNKTKLILSSILIFFLNSQSIIAAESLVPLKKPSINSKDKASLQRGSQIYMNNCLGCHSLKFARLDYVAKGIGITDEAGNILKDIVKDNLLFTGDKISDPILTAMPATDAANWFGKEPPDLSLITRSRGIDWLYTYMLNFYADPDKQWGVNNLVFPDVGMPHVLLNLQGVQEVISGKREIVTRVTIPGKVTTQEYDKLVTDLVNFLDYVGEPKKLEREKIGLWVLVFLIVLSIVSYLFKREYWKDVR